MYTCNVVFSVRQIAQRACEDLSADFHTEEYLRGNIHSIHLPWQFKVLLYHYTMCQLLYVCRMCVCMQI